VSAPGVIAKWEATPLELRPELFTWLHQRELLADLRGLAGDYYGTPFGLWRDDPCGFVTTVLNETLTDIQRQILVSLRDNPRTVVPACFASSKTHSIGRAVAWAALAHPIGSTRVVVSASRLRQVITQIWPHVRRLQAEHHLPGTITATQWKIPSRNGLEELVADGFTPPRHEPEAVQGVHASYVFVFLDEAGLIPERTGKAWQSATTGLHTRMLVTGNPPIDEEDTWLEKIATSSEWNRITISCEVTPNWTGEEVGPCKTCPDWRSRPHPVSDHLINKEDVAGWIREYGEGDPFVEAKAYARFPTGGTPKMVPRSWVDRARVKRINGVPDRDLDDARGPLPPPNRRHPIFWVRVGVDFAITGGDELAVALRVGDLARVVHTQRGQVNASAVDVAGVVKDHVLEAQEVRARHGATGPGYPLALVLDATGIGWGPASTLIAWASEGMLGPDVSVIPVNMGERAEDSARYANRRAEMWSALRSEIQPDEEGYQTLALDIDDRSVIQIGDPKRKRHSTGRVLVESVDELTARGRKSPDRATSLALTCYLPESLLPKRKRQLIIGGG
jgi:hypothetical protein